MTTAGHADDGGRPVSAFQWVIGILLAAAVVAGVEWYIGWRLLLTPWQGLGAHALAFTLILVFASYLARAARVHALFRDQVAGRLRLSLKLVLLNTLANNLLPMRMGELSFPLLMKRYFQVPLGAATAGLAWLRLMDLHTLAGLALVGLLPGRQGGVPVWLVLAAWLALPLLLYRFQRSVLAWLGGGRWGHHAAAVAAGLPADRFAFWQCWIWTVLTWVSKLSVFVWLLIAFSGAQVESAVMGALGGELTSVLPFHGVAGMGTYEAGVVAGMTPWGVPLKDAVAAAVNLHLFLLGASILGGGVALLLKDRGGRG